MLRLTPQKLHTYITEKIKEKEELFILLISTKCNLVGQHVTKRLTTLYDHIFIIILLTEQTSPKTFFVLFMRGSTATSFGPSHHHHHHDHDHYIHA